MKEKLLKLLHYIGAHITGVAVGTVTMVMVLTVATGVSGKDLGFDPNGILISALPGSSDLPDKTGYDLSGEGEDSREVNPDSGEDQSETEASHPDENPDITQSEEPSSLPETPDEQVIVPDEIAGDLPPEETTGATVSPADGPDVVPGKRPDHSRRDDWDSDSSDDERWSSSASGGRPWGGSQESSDSPENNPPSESQPTTDGTITPPEPSKPADKPADPPPPPLPLPPSGDTISVVIGGENKVFESEDEALAWIADNAGKNQEGQYFEGFKKDEEGNLIPSYTDKENFGSNNDAAWNYLGNSDTFVVPEGIPVLELAMVSDNDKIKTIVISKTVASILTGDGSSFSNLEKFVVSADHPRYLSVDGVLYLKSDDTMELCMVPSAKTEIKTWPDRLTTIGENSFYHSRLEQITLPDTVTAIKSYAFNGSFAKTIVLPESVKTIGSSAFAFEYPGENQEPAFHQIIVKSQEPAELSSTTFYWMDYNLEGKRGEPVTRITVPDSLDDTVFEAYLASWGAALDKRYGQGMALKILATEDGAETRYEYFEFNGKNGYKKKDEETPPVLTDSMGIYRIDDDGNLVLVKCTSTDSVILFSDSKIVSIDEGAFDDCTSMTAIRFPETLKTMPNHVFAHNPKLRVIISYAPAPPAEFSGAPQNCAVFVRPESLQDYEEAWQGQVRKIMGTWDTYSVTTSGLVFDMESTRLIDIPSDLTTLSVPSYVISIYPGMAAGHPTLKQLTIPVNSKLTDMGSGAFAQCLKLQTVSWGVSAPVPDSCFEGCSSLVTFGAPNSNNGGHQLTSFGDRAFYGCSSLKTVLYYSYPLGGTNYYYYYYLDHIGEEAFYGCTSMTYAYLHSSVTSVGDRAFEKSGLTDLYWYTDVPVPDSCFENCTALKTVGWGDGLVTALGDRAFYGCAKLETLTLPANIASIGQWTFDGRDSKPLTLTFASQIPIIWDGPDSLDRLVIYVPDSDGDKVWLAYLDAWGNWLGDHPEAVLKTRGGINAGTATSSNAVYQTATPQNGTAEKNKGDIQSWS